MTFEGGLNLGIAGWPVVILLFAVMFHRKQNSKTAWTGGQISWPKAFWLFYTVLTWFIYPFFFLFHPELPANYFWPFALHLFSWWVRGPLELLMIYKWLNWKPLYGISHDIFHLILIVSVALYWGVFSTATNATAELAQWFYGSLFLSTAAETYFVARFKDLRSEKEGRDNVYFASTDPKWKKVNVITGIVVTSLILQMLYISGKIVLD